MPETLREKRADELLVGDIIVERDKKRLHFYKVTGIKVAACTVSKTHVTVEGHTAWCYDSALPVLVR